VLFLDALLTKKPDYHDHRRRTGEWMAPDQKPLRPAASACCPANVSFGRGEPNPWGNCGYDPVPESDTEKPEEAP
jgi:hypothetical protein